MQSSRVIKAVLLAVVQSLIIQLTFHLALIIAVFGEFTGWMILPLSLMPLTLFVVSVGAVIAVLRNKNVRGWLIVTFVLDVTFLPMVVL